MQETLKKRKVYYDFLRILAILCIIFNHTDNRGYYLYALTDKITVKYFYYMFSALIAMGVPIFFMISGALLLGKEESFQKICRHRVARILLVIVIFSMVQYLFQVCTGKAEGVHLGYFIGHVLSGDIIIPYWFLYQYLMFLLILPFLRMLVKAMKPKHYLYLLGLYLLIDGVLAVALSFYGLNVDKYDQPMFSRIIIWPLLGYYMENLLLQKYYRMKYVFAGCACSFIALFVIAYMSARRGLTIDQFTDYDKGLYTCSLTAIYAVTFFYLAKYFFQKVKIPLKLYRLITVLGGATFGVYLMEQPIRESTIFLWDYLAPYVSRFGAAIIWTVLIFLCTAIITLILKKIPGIKQLL